MIGRQLFLLGILPAVIFAQKTKQIPDGPRGNGAVFSKCGGIFGSSLGGNDRCYEVRVTKLQVQIGPDGTNDDVSAKICSDDKKTCCTTPALDKTARDDWSKNDLETWKKSYFGECKDFKFKIRKGLEVTLQKKGTDTLGVQSLFVEAEAVTKDKKEVELERFECGAYTIGGTGPKASSSKAKNCKSSPYVYERVKSINVTMGPQGTNDNVKVDICSNVNDVCCKFKLSSLLSDDWSKNDNEVWTESSFGDCKTMLYKMNQGNPNSGPRLTLVKDGKTDLIVNKLVLNTEDSYGKKYRYDCGDYKLQSQGQKCVQGVNCVQTNTCKKKALPTLGLTVKGKKNPTTKRPSVTTRRSNRIATSTTKKTTTRAPFRSGSG